MTPKPAHSFLWNLAFDRFLPGKKLPNRSTDVPERAGQAVPEIKNYMPFQTERIMRRTH
jgi:hypothetical protein